MSKERVVCINDNWSEYTVEGNPSSKYKLPVKGEIYTVVRVVDDKYLSLFELPGCAFNINKFRPVEDGFGPAICERVEDQINYEIEIEDEK